MSTTKIAHPPQDKLYTEEIVPSFNGKEIWVQIMLMGKYLNSEKIVVSQGLGAATAEQKNRRLCSRRDLQLSLVKKQ